LVTFRTNSESSSSQKIYQYVPNDQRKEGDPVFCIINKPSQNRGISFPTPLPPLVQYKIKQAKIEMNNKSKMAAQGTLLNRDDKTLPISLYDNKVLYTMQ